MSKRPVPRLSLNALQVLRAFVAAPGKELAGTDLLAGDWISSGTLYPILTRMQSVGWLRGRWEEVDPRKVKRPKRRYYRLTDAGLEVARKVFADLELPS